MPLSAEAVRGARFSSRRRGWDEDEVRLFLNTVANDIQAADRERAELRAALHEMRTELDRVRGEASEAGNSRVEISVHAVGLLSQAQQTADSCVAEAEQYARDLVTTARTEYREILLRAQEAAAHSMRELSDLELGAGHHEHGVSLEEVEYVRTYARVAQVQLRSVLDALTQEVDKLGQVPSIDQSQVPALPPDVSWQPANVVSLTASRHEGP
jgi:DivIVA domain-containing protein